MKRIIKKILNLFGYYKKDDIEYELSKKRVECVHNNKVEYNAIYIKKDNNLHQFDILCFYKDIKYSHIIKSFITDDYEYGLLCMREDIEMLQNLH